MNETVMDTLQWAFDRVYELVPRKLRRHAVDPLLVGHRGVYEHPRIRENTLEAFDLAIAYGGGIEFDLHLTRDKVVIVHHDPTLARVHGARHAVRDLTAAQLREVAPAVPTLQELLERYGHRCPHYFIEPKVRQADDMETLLAQTATLLERHRVTGSATMITPDFRMLDLARRKTPQLAKAIIFFIDPRPAVAYVREHGDTGLAGWHFAYPDSVRPFLDQRGLHIGVGQIDFPNTHRHYRNRGFRYQFSNRIDRLVPPVETLTLPPLRSLVGRPG